SVVFHVSQHPEYPDFYQCVSFGFFRSQVEETAYNLFCVFAMYFVPLFVICFAYSCILFEITSKSRETKEGLRRPGWCSGASDIELGPAERRPAERRPADRSVSRTLAPEVGCSAAHSSAQLPSSADEPWRRVAKSETR
ncbi:AKH/corazonin-related peptide receptor, partial [Gryllus bimaculatus]